MAAPWQQMLNPVENSEGWELAGEGKMDLWQITTLHQKFDVKPISREADIGVVNGANTFYFFFVLHISYNLRGKGKESQEIMETY